MEVYMKFLYMLFVLTILSFQVNYIISMEKDNVNASRVVEEYFPTEWKQIVLGLFIKNMKTNSSFAQKNWMNDESFMSKIWRKILKHEKVRYEHNRNPGWYWIFSSMNSYSGRHCEVTLKDVVRKHDFSRSVSSRNLTIRSGVVRKHDFVRSVSCKGFSKKNTTIKDLVGNYKIHMMPKNSSYFDVLSRLLEILKTDKLLYPYVNSFKCKECLLTKSELLKQNLEEVVPRFVIYPNTGKDNAQIVLNALRTCFKGNEGIGVSPRYNEAVIEKEGKNPFLFVAQGDGDYKGEGWEKYYENKECIYYSRCIEGGNPKDYHLKIGNMGLTKSN